MDNQPFFLNAIKEGEEYEGYQCKVRRKSDGVISMGWCIPSVAPNDGYALSRFIPCDDLDETTLVNEEWEEKYFQPINSRP